MILYRTTDGDVQTTPSSVRPRSCFIMTQLGGAVPPSVTEIRSRVEALLASAGYTCFDANSVTQGRDFLIKIWELAVSAPVGIAIIDQQMPAQTLANIFYEFGWMQAMGKETLVVKTPGTRIPSDFVRTEYITYDAHFERRFRSFISYLRERAAYFLLVADQLERNPLLSVDYYRRAYLLTGDRSLAGRAAEILRTAGLGGRAASSAEMLLAGFAPGRRERKLLKKRASRRVEEE